MAVALGAVRALLGMGLCDIVNGWCESDLCGRTTDLSLGCLPV